MVVRGIENLTLRDLIEHVKHGGRFVVHHWCIGVGLAVRQLPSPVRFVRPEDRTAGRGGWRTILTMLTGWWAIPAGPRQTIRCLRENLAGGRDVTAAVLKAIANSGTVPSKSHVTSHAA
jgi:hypothetical protein